jgi:hypothetical protein
MDTELDVASQTSTEEFKLSVERSIMNACNYGYDDPQVEKVEKVDRIGGVRGEFFIAWIKSEAECDPEGQFGIVYNADSFDYQITRGVPHTWLEKDHFFSLDAAVQEMVVQKVGLYDDEVQDLAYNELCEASYSYDPRLSDAGDTEYTEDGEKYLITLFSFEGSEKEIGISVDSQGLYTVCTPDKKPGTKTFRNHFDALAKVRSLFKADFLDFMTDEAKEIAENLAENLADQITEADYTKALNWVSRTWKKSAKNAIFAASPSDESSRRYADEIREIMTDALMDAYENKVQLQADVHD